MSLLNRHPTLRRSRIAPVLGVMVLVGVLFPALPASGATVFVVDDDGFGTAADCNAVAPAVPVTIQGGIDLAAATGDTVFVCPGIYQPTAMINVDEEVTITSGDAATAIVLGDTKNGIVGGDGDDVLFSVEEDNVTIEKLTIDLGDENTDFDVGVFTANAGGIDNLIIQDSVFRFATTAGTGEQLIHLGGGTGNTVRRNNLETASSNSVVYVGEGTNTSLTFEDNTVLAVSDADGGGTAINAFGPIVNSTFEGNTFTKTGIGIYLGSGTTATNNVTVIDNTFTGTTGAHPYGALVITSEVDGVAIGNIDVTMNTFNTGVGPAISIFDTVNPANPDVNGATVTVNNNAINLGNGSGLTLGLGVTGTVDAECNWWGHSSGPSGAGLGTGSTVSPGTDFTPWLATNNLAGTCGGAPLGDGSASETVAVGGTVSTDHTGDGPTATTPIETWVTTPTGGTVTVTAGVPTSPAGFTVFGTQVAITAPVETAAIPLAIWFFVDGSVIPAGIDGADLEVLKNGVPVPNCTGPAGQAVPDPCVESRTSLSDGDVRIRVRTSTASVWLIGGSSLCKGMVPDILGTNGADTLTGTAADNVIWAGPGNDVVNGMGGDDTICLGDGNDQADGGAGKDAIYGGAGNDVIFGGFGADILDGKSGNDTVVGQKGNDWLWGGSGTDTLRGGEGSDKLFGKAGDDTLKGWEGKDKLWGNAGDDILNGGPDTDKGHGGAGADTCVSIETQTSC